jgi:hypothetical protein
MYARVIDGQVVQVGLPRAGVIDGRTVSNYHLLPEAVLLAEGWLPLELNQPEYNPEIQTLNLVGYTIQSNKVIANYEVVVMMPTLDSRLEAAEAVLMDILEAMM